MVIDSGAEAKRMVRANALSVTRKLLTGTLVILLVGVLAFMSLLILMYFM